MREYGNVRIPGKEEFSWLKREKSEEEVRKTEIEKSISRFLKEQLEAQKRAKKKEKIQVNINPNSYIGKEIQYQTALLHEILEEMRRNKGSNNAASIDQLEKRIADLETNTQSQRKITQKILLMLKKWGAAID